jgi:hypothetical protein
MTLEWMLRGSKKMCSRQFWVAEELYATSLLADV